MSTIFLRWVNTQQLHDLYSNSQIIDRPIKILPERIYFRTSLFQDQGDQYDQRIYHKVNSSNKVQRFCNREHQIVSYFIGHKHRKSQGGTCLWCRRVFEGSHFGIIIDVKSKVFTSPEGRSKIVTINLEEGIFCRMSCAYAELCRIQDSRHPPIRYNRSRELMNQLHQTLLHLNNIPYYELRPSADFRLLDINGGPLKEKEYFSPQYRFVEIPNTFFIPNSIVYEIVSQELAPVLANK